VTLPQGKSPKELLMVTYLDTMFLKVKFTNFFQIQFLRGAYYGREDSTGTRFSWSFLPWPKHWDPGGSN
jgi:hypothetical protein